MKSFSFFDVFDYSVAFILILISVIFILYYYFKIKRDSNNPDSKTKLKGRRLNIPLGLLLIIISIVFYIIIEIDIRNQAQILQHIAGKTSEPVILFLLALFLFGLVLAIIGFYHNFIIIKNRTKTL